MKLYNILLLASILPVGESRSSDKPWRGGDKPWRGGDNAWMSSDKSSQEKRKIILPQTSTKTNTSQSLEESYLPEDDQKIAYKTLGGSISAFLAENNLIENKTIKTKHGYAFEVNTDPKNICFDNNTTEERFKTVAKQWQDKVLAVYISALKTKNLDLATKAHSILERITHLENEEWKKAPEIEQPLVTTAQALKKYQGTAFYPELTAKFASEEQVLQQDVDDYANNLKLPTGKVIADYDERKKFLSIMFAQKETVLPEDVVQLTKHKLKLEQVLKDLPAVKHDRESVCSGCAFFESETQDIIPLYNNMETTPENKRLEMQTRAAIAKLADPEVFNIKEESITAIDTSLKVCQAKIYELEQEIGKKRGELAALVKKNSQTSFEKKEKLTPLQDSSSVKIPTDVEKLHQEIAILEYFVKNLEIDLNTLRSSKERATEARALQKAVLLQLASNADMTLDLVPTITSIQKSRFNPFGVSLPAKTTETPLALFTRIAHQQTKEKHPDEGSTAYLAMYRRLTSKHEAARWTEAKRTSYELEELKKN